MTHHSRIASADASNAPDLLLAAQSPPRTRSVRRWLAKWSRWLHIYLSMFGLAAILFFSVTGLTLNHPEWFFAERLTRVEGALPTTWLHVDANPPQDWDEYDYSHQIAKLEVAEYLRAEHGLRGQVSDFLAFEDECELTFQGPGYAAVGRIRRDTGDYTVEVATNDLVTVLNDLHKGRHSGNEWSWVIDVSAVVGTLVAGTGFVLIFFLRLRRLQAIAAAACGGIVLWIMCVVARS